MECRRRAECEYSSEVVVDVAAEVGRRLRVCAGVGVQVEVEAETAVKRKRTGVVGGEGVGVEAWVSGWIAM